MTGGRIRLDTKVASDRKVSRTKAATLVMAGLVTRSTERLTKPGQLVSVGETLEYAETDHPVSRAGGKLEPAFSQWRWSVDGDVALDVGASTGGFTQVLLEQGARLVYAVDVGRGQLDWRLRQDPRVVSLEQLDIRDLDPLPEQPSVAVVDVSFTSLRRVLPAIESLVPPSTNVAALFKPQFEVGKAVADRFRGVITDHSVTSESLDGFKEWLAAHNWTVKTTLPSPVKGTRGNQEYLLWLITPPAR